MQTNGQLQTSNPDVYAIGDIAAFPLPRYGGKVSRQEHVQNARESAKHAVTAILAPAEAGDYNYLPVSAAAAPTVTGEGRCMMISENCPRSPDCMR